MRVLVDGVDTVIEGEVIGGTPVGGVDGQFDLGDEFTVRCDDGQCFLINGWMVEVEILSDAPLWVM
ncbi:hypothetical protein HDF16_005036 [Granulicella aggregans]|uniref:Uncharacterized protein n=1 Tax=Granulicella aggregans TaxID=474949 RepID=A0A7W7ZHZ8_9BACT|nr:hypothetical protein [Granulicella aggregans]MBB5060300.1 hypothetical protein [Granulicella aggregans]